MNINRKRRIALLTALAILLFAGSVWAACTAHSKDSDHDGIPNCMEKKLGTNPHSADTDHDGLSDGLELMLGTDPKNADTDGDGVSDGMEEAHGGDPMDSGDEDDGDHAVSARIKSPVTAVDPAAGTVTLLGGRLTVDASHAEFEGVDDLATLKSRLDAGTTIMAKVKIEPASLGGAGMLVATKLEVDGGEDGNDVRCCLPGSGAHDDCEQHSAGDCSDAGGLNMGPGSCEPNPCP